MYKNTEPQPHENITSMDLLRKHYSGLTERSLNEAKKKINEECTESLEKKLTYLHRKSRSSGERLNVVSIEPAVGDGRRANKMHKIEIKE